MSMKEKRGMTLYCTTKEKGKEDLNFLEEAFLQNDSGKAIDFIRFLD